MSGVRRPASTSASHAASQVGRASVSSGDKCVHIRAHIRPYLNAPTWQEQQAPGSDHSPTVSPVHSEPPRRRAEARSTPRPRPRLSSRLLRREELAATAFGNADLASSGTPVGLVEPCFAWVMAVAVGRATEWVGKRGRSYARSMLDDL